MTTARYDGAYLAPAARLRGHGALRLALSRVVSAREANARRSGGGHFRALDDAGLATFARHREELDLAGQSLYPL